MKNSIYSSFNLNKSLEQFQEKVTKLLELTNISEWDGRVFKEREEEIRESALILAGECTALLLHTALPAIMQYPDFSLSLSCHSF